MSGRSQQQLMPRIYASETTQWEFWDAEIWLTLDGDGKFQLRIELSCWEGSEGERKISGQWQETERTILLSALESDVPQYPAGSVISVEVLDDGSLAFVNRKLIKQ